MTTAAALLFSSRSFEPVRACVASACAACWGTWGPTYRGRAQAWSLRVWSGSLHTGLRQIAQLSEREELILSDLSVLPLPEAGTSLFSPLRPPGEGFLRDLAHGIHECDPKLPLGLWIFYLRGSRRAPPLQRRDSPLAVCPRTKLEANCAYTNLVFG